MLCIYFCYAYFIINILKLIDENGIGEYRLAPAYDLLSVLLADKNVTDEI